MERSYYDIFSRLTDGFGWEMAGSTIDLQRAKERCDFLSRECKEDCRVYRKTYLNGVEKKYEMVYESKAETGE